MDARDIPFIPALLAYLFFSLVAAVVWAILAVLARMAPENYGPTLTRWARDARLAAFAILLLYVGLTAAAIVLDALPTNP